MNSYFALDGLNTVFLIVLVLVTIGVVIYQGKQPLKYNLIFILFFISMTGAILSTHLGLTWVFVEATTLTSAYLILTNKNKNSLEAAWKYVFLCSIGISLAFIGIILLLMGSGEINSLFFEDLYKNASLIDKFWLKLSFVFILIGFGTKVGLAPVHSWLPDAHAEAPSPVSAMLSATLLNSAFLVIFKYYKLMELSGIAQTAKTMLMAFGLLSLFVSAVYIYRIGNYKRMLAYSSIENMGIISIGIALGGIGIFASILHLAAHSLIKASFFMTSGNILHLYNSKEIQDVKNLIQKDKTTGILWLLCAILIAGIPPSPIFISEFLIAKQFLMNGQHILLVLFLLLLTIIFYGIMNAVIKMLFEKEENSVSKKFSLNKYIPQICLILISIVFYFSNFANDLIERAFLWF